MSQERETPTNSQATPSYQYYQRNLLSQELVIFQKAPKSIQKDQKQANMHVNLCG